MLYSTITEYTLFANAPGSSPSCIIEIALKYYGVYFLTMLELNYESILMNYLEIFKMFENLKHISK